MRQRSRIALEEGLSGGEPEEALDHRVHLLGHFELVEVARADRDPYLKVRFDREQSDCLWVAA